MYSDDEKWITEQIIGLPTYEMRKQAFDGYVSVYNKVFTNEPVEHRKIGQARKSANTALRKYIIKCNIWSEQLNRKMVL